MNKKNPQIEKLTNYLLSKYSSANIIVTDYWDDDNDAIGFADKTKQYTIYISNSDSNDNFFVSLENPPTSNAFPYTPGEDFDNLTTEEVEKILITHLKIV